MQTILTPQQRAALSIILGNTANNYKQQAKTALRLKTGRAGVWLKDEREARDLKKLIDEAELIVVTTAIPAATAATREDLAEKQADYQNTQRRKWREAIGRKFRIRVGPNKTVAAIPAWLLGRDSEPAGQTASGTQAPEPTSAAASQQTSPREPQAATAGGAPIQGTQPLPLDCSAQATPQPGSGTAYQAPEPAAQPHHVARPAGAEAQSKTGSSPDSEPSDAQAQAPAA